MRKIRVLQLPNCTWFIALNPREIEDEYGHGNFGHTERPTSHEVDGAWAKNHWTHVQNAKTTFATLEAALQEVGEKRQLMEVAGFDVT